MVYNILMGILDNLENSWDLNPPEFESTNMVETDAMGRNKFWQEDPNLAVKLFSETCCTDCECKNG